MAPPPPPRLDCFHRNASYEPLDMENTSASEEVDAYACQRRCQDHDRCVHFSFWVVEGLGHGVCHLQDAYAIRVEGALGCLSGPFACWQVMPQRQDLSRHGESTFLPRRFDCMSRGWSYAPILADRLRTFPVEQVPSKEKAVMKCQDYCFSVPECAFFSMDVNTRLCSLASSSAKRFWNGAHLISGEKACHVGASGKFLLGAVEALPLSLSTLSAILTATLAIGCTAAAAATVHRFAWCMPRRTCSRLPTSPSGSSAAGWASAASSVWSRAQSRAPPLRTGTASVGRRGRGCGRQAAERGRYSSVAMEEDPPPSDDEDNDEDDEDDLPEDFWQL